MSDVDALSQCHLVFSFWASNSESDLPLYIVCVNVLSVVGWCLSMSQCLFCRRSEDTLNKVSYHMA